MSAMSATGLPVPTLLVVFDGWGERAERHGNAIRLARTPAYDRLLATSPHTLLSASGEDVGLPAGLMGNSEVGHLNLGAGRVVDQDIQRIGRSIRTGDFSRNPVVTALVDGALARGSALHVLGLLSPGGVHSLDDHIFATVELAALRGLTDIRVHAFLDGRDTPPRSAAGFVARFEERLVALGAGRIASISGRYYAMDRDRRWERVERAWRAIVLGEGEEAPTAAAAIVRSYERGVSDEFLPPSVIARPDGSRSRLDAGAAIFFANFRADRARQMSRALADAAFDGFARPVSPAVDMATMTEYDPTLGLRSAFPPVVLEGILADVMATGRSRNLRAAETEKYAHVTYFFNGGVEKAWPGESRCLIPSPKVATYDLAPEMSAAPLTDAVVRALAKGEEAVIIVNYANADMVGHTGRLGPTIRAVEVLDEALGRLMAAADAAGYGLLLTSDHGNAEMMIDPLTGEPHTAHTTNPVPFVLRSPGLSGATLAGDGRLGDVAPTLLDLWQIEKPRSMTGRSLLRR